MQNVLNLILSHQTAEDFVCLEQYWRRLGQFEILLAYGGSAEEFGPIQHEPKLAIDDPRLRTRDHPREQQSYTALFHAAADWLCDRRQYEFINFVEYDHVPLLPDFNQRQIEKLKEENADVLGYHLKRIDGTNHPHYLFQTRSPSFHEYIRTLSSRDDPRVVLTMLGTGSFWRREAFLAVAAEREPFPIYVEIYLPTLAHHLGFRMRDYGEQNRFVHYGEIPLNSIAEARRRGAWTIHPVKRLGDLRK